MRILDGVKRQLRAHVVPRMASVCASIAGIAFLASFARWMIIWRGVPHWHQWYDQGEYLKSARALAIGDLSPSLHFYPPLYPLLAAPFSWLSPDEPFFVINLIALAAAVAMLVRMFASVIGSPIVAGLFAVGYLAHRGVLFETFVVPWTSTPATFLVIAALYCLMKIEQDHDAGLKYSLMFGLMLGLLVPTRPPDAIAALSLVPFWMLSTWRATVFGRDSGRMRSFVSHTIGAGIGASVGPVVLFSFNFLVFGRPLSPYVATSSSQFFWGNLPEKFISIFLDSGTLFIQPAQTLLARFPWVTVGLCAIAICLRYGPIWLRAASTAVALQFVVYLAFTDLLPSGLYNYLNYHYFRWALWLDFLMLPAAWVLLQRRLQGRAWQPVALWLFFAAALACLQLRTTEASVSIVRSDDRIVIDLPPQARSDYVDVAGLEADWQKTYFDDHHAEYDGRRLRRKVDLKALQTIAGTRLLFLKPLTGGRFELLLNGWTLHTPLSATVGSTSLAMGIPRSMVRQFNYLPVGVDLRLDGLPSNFLFASGFSVDGDRRIVTGRQARLDLSLEPRSTPYRMRLSLIARKPIHVDFHFMNSADPALTVEADAQLREFDLSIPPAAVATWRPTSVLIRPQWPSGSEPDASLAVTALRVD